MQLSMIKVEVDAENKQYCISTKFWGITLPSAWYELPDFEYISIFKAK